MKMPKLVLLLGMIMYPLTSSLFALGEDVSPESTEAVRIVAAKEKLVQESDTVVLYAKGLCCPSCSIGVRKMVSRLDFVDRKRFNKGVELDTKTQLISVALLESKEADFDSLSEAITDAGYDPVRSYSLVGGELQTNSLVSK